MASTSTPIRMVHVHYRGGGLELRDSDNRTPLYQLNVNRHIPQFKMHHANALSQTNSDAAIESSLYAATFKNFSTQVQLELQGTHVTMSRSHAFTRTYEFKSPSMDGRKLCWEADGALTGDFRLVDPSDGDRCVRVRYHNRLFSNSEVGSFEVIGSMSSDTLSEALITGLSVLVMMQSLNLAGMVLFG